MPRRRSSAQRSGSIPVSARTSVDLPWSTWPAVATTLIPELEPAPGRSRPRAGRRPRAAPSAGRPRTGPARRARGRDRRPGAARSAASTGRATPALASSTPGAPPPPTWAAQSTATPPTFSASAAARTRRSSTSASSIARTGGSGPRSVASSAASVSLSTRSARASGWRRRRCDEVGVAEHQPGLRAAEQLVARRGDEIRPGPQLAGRVRLRGQQRVRREQPRPDVGHHGHAQPDQVGDRHRRREPGDDEVRRVDLEDHAGVRTDGVGVVGAVHAVGGADLAQPCAGDSSRSGRRNPSPISTISPRAMTISRPDGQRRRRQDQRRRPVVGDVHAARVGDGRGQRARRARARAGRARR